LAEIIKEALKWRETDEATESLEIILEKIAKI
jgi:hypothetical protein